MSVVVCILGYLTSRAISAHCDPSEVDWKFNTNQQTVDPLEYSGEWKGHVYTPSPENWRFPFYTLILDRFVNGDPTNDDINGTTFEHDLMSNQLRCGVDLSGLVESLDYLQGMGIKVSCGMRLAERTKSLTKSKGLYIAGAPFLNFAVQIRRLLGTISSAYVEHRRVNCHSSLSISPSSTTISERSKNGKQR